MSKAPNPPTPPQRPATVPAELDPTVRMVPPIKCRWIGKDGQMGGCGRGISPRVERWRTRQSDGADYACCRCTLCGRPFVYYPATKTNPPQVRGVDASGN